MCAACARVYVWRGGEFHLNVFLLYLTDNRISKTKFEVSLMNFDIFVLVSM